MSDMQPIGTPLTMLDGVERHVLFTLSVVDEVQSKYDQTVPEVFQRTANLKEQSDIIAFLVTTLINHAAKRSGKKDEAVTEEYVKDNIDMIILPKINRAIGKSYGYSIPDPEDDEEIESDLKTEPNS